MWCIELAYINLGEHGRTIAYKGASCPCMHKMNKVLLIKAKEGRERERTHKPQDRERERERERERWCQALSKWHSQGSSCPLPSFASTALTFRASLASAITDLHPRSSPASLQSCESVQNRGREVRGLCGPSGVSNCGFECDWTWSCGAPAEPAVVVPCPCAASDAECATRNQPPRCVVFGCLSVCLSVRCEFGGFLALVPCV
jgi:hypothetical protein